MTAIAALFGKEGTVVRDRPFQMLLLANLNAPLGVALVSPLLDSLLGPFGVSPTRIGLMVTAFTAPSVVVIPLVGVLSDRYGRKPILVGGLVLFGVAGSAISLTMSFSAVLALRVVQGVAHAGLTPVIVTSVGDLYAGAEEATAQGLRFASSGDTQAIFPLLAGILITVGWQYPFLLYTLAVPTALVLLVGFPEPTDQDDESIPADTTTDSGSGTSDPFTSLREFAVRPHVLSVLVIRGLPNFIYFGLLTYNSFVVVRLLDGTPAQAGLIVAMTSVVYAGTATQAGRITAAFDGRAVPLVVAHLCMGGGMTLVAAAPSLPVVGVGAVGVGVGVGVTASFYRSVITGLAPTDLRGGLFALGESSGRLASTVVPVAMGATTGALEPLFGFDVAVRWTVLGVGLVSALVGIGGVYVALAASPAPARHIVERS